MKGLEDARGAGGRAGDAKSVRLIGGLFHCLGYFGWWNRGLTLMWGGGK
jgi:hypothetical protein